MPTKTTNQDDRKWLNQLLPSLRALRNPPTEIPFWFDDHLESGEKWEQQIYDHIDRARVAVLLVSRQFFASEFITRNELPRILAASTQGELKVLPLLLEECRHDQLNDRQFAGPRRDHALVPVERLSESDRHGFWKELEGAIRAAFHSTTPLDEVAAFPTPVGDALIHLCEPDPKIRRLGLRGLAEFFGADAGRPPPWAWQYLEWAKVQLGCFARDPDKDLAAVAALVLKSLPTRIPAALSTKGRGSHCSGSR